jgi:hypothetical protein
LFAVDISILDSDARRIVIVSTPVFAYVPHGVNKKRFNHWQRFGLWIRLSEYFAFMKFSLSLALFTAFLAASCSEEPQPPPPRHRVANYPPTQPEQYPPPQQPFNPNGPVQPTGTPPVETAAAPPPPPAAPTKIAKGDYPYGIPVPGKPHLVESPYSPGKYIDVEGFPPGTEVKDPYTDKIFLVP